MLICEVWHLHFLLEPTFSPLEETVYKVCGLIWLFITLYTTSMGEFHQLLHISVVGMQYLTVKHI